jgi:capsular polysaccharide transport system permease protein
MLDASKVTTYARLLRLTPVDGFGLESRAPSVDGDTPLRPARQPLQGLFSLALLVLLPTCVAIGYFGFLAADRFESEARFVLRAPGRSLPGASVSGLMQSTGINRTDDDGYVVREYLTSRDALAWLEKTAGLEAAYADAKWDPIWRFPNFLTRNNKEALYRHFLWMTSSSYDNGTGVSTLKVEAFSPRDAQRMAIALLDAAEALVNRLNERARRDAIGSAEAEVDRMRARVFAAQAALMAFREQQHLIDPSQATVAVLGTIAKLSVEATQLSVQLSELSKSSPDAPQVSALRTRRTALDGQIAIERRRLAGDSQAIAPRIVEYERLMLELEFSERALIAAMTAVETARVEAARQQVYLERITTPGQPDYPAYPHRLVWCLVTLGAGLMAWRIWRILAEVALRHLDL